MAIRARIHRHPHITAAVTFVLALLIFGWAMPWVWHEPREWGRTILISVGLGMVSYFNRLHSGRVKAVILAAASLGALVVYAVFVRSHGIPQDTTERFYFAGVVAIPVFGIALAFWMARKGRMLA